MPRYTQKSRYWLILALCVGISVFGVCRAVHIRHPDKGGQGGALATVIAIVALLVRRDYGRELYLSEIKDVASLPTIQEQHTVRITALEDRLDINSSGQTAQSWWAAGASIVGAVFWGFGDVLAHWLCKCPPPH